MEAPHLCRFNRICRHDPLKRSKRDETADPFDHQRDCAVPCQRTRSGQIEELPADYDWRRGDRISRDRYVILDEGDRVIFDGQEYVVIDTDNGTILRRDDDFYRLPRYDDSDYVRIGDQVLRVNRETKEVIDLIRLADLVLG